jgi:hypothetical protein
LKAYSSASNTKQTCNLTKEMLQYINTQKIGYRKKKEETNSVLMNEEDRIRGMYPTIRRFKGLNVTNLIYIKLIT